MKKTWQAVAITLTFLLTTASAFAHCDSLNGPVVSDARLALESGRVDLVLKWVAPKDEAAVRDAFDRARAVREQSDAARELADRWFFETVVRLHRANEGEPFAGLRSADWKPPHLIELADAAVARADTADLQNAVLAAVSSGLRERWQRVIETKKHADESVAAGRAYVAAYTDFLRFIEAADVAAGEASTHAELEGSQRH